MDILQVITLSFIQGVTEFIPVSSSAHLLIISDWMSWSYSSLAFSVALHLGSLIAICLYLRKDLYDLTQGVLTALKEKQMNQSARLFVTLCCATLPLCFVTLFGYTFLKSFANSLLVIASTTLIFGLILGIAILKAEHYLLRLPKSWAYILIGVAQCFAIIPGASRSGVTLTAGLFLGLSYQQALRFSFLLSIPCILLASCWQGLTLYRHPEAIVFFDFILGIVLSAGVGLLVIDTIFKKLSKTLLLGLVSYRLLLAMLLFTQVIR